MQIVNKWAPMVVRILLGLIFFVFGLNGFLGFIPLPELPSEAGAFMGALAATGYFFPVLKITEILAGAMLLTNRFVPLALILLSPIVVQIALFHLVLTPGDLVMALVQVVFLGYLGWAYRGAFRSVLAAKVAPAHSDQAAALGEPSSAAV